MSKIKITAMLIVLTLASACSRNTSSAWDNAYNGGSVSAQNVLD